MKLSNGKVSKGQKAELEEFFSFPTATKTL